MLKRKPHTLTRYRGLTWLATLRKSAANRLGSSRLCRSSKEHRMSFIRPVAKITVIALLLTSLSRGGEPPKEPRSEKAHVDLYGDPLPQGAIARLGTVRFRHPGSVRAAAFSPDGRFIAASSDGL